MDIPTNVILGYHNIHKISRMVSVIQGYVQISTCVRQTKWKCFKIL